MLRHSAFQAYRGLACAQSRRANEAGPNWVFAVSPRHRVPHADGTLYRLDVEEDAALMPAVASHALRRDGRTGHHAAVVATVAPGKSVAVLGDGAVGLCGVI